MTKPPPPKEKPDLALRERNLRRLTCEFLRLPAFETLSPSEKTRVDLVGALNEEIRDLRMAQLSGRTDVDIARLVEAGKQLQALCDAHPPEGSQAGLEAARAKLRAVLGVLEPDLVAEADGDLPPRKSELQILREENEAMRTELFELRSRARPAPEPEQRADNIVPITRTPLPVPPHYLAEHQRQHEPWRDPTGGVICPPYFDTDLPRK